MSVAMRLQCGLILSMVIVALALAGCGGGSGTGSATTTSISANSSSSISSLQPNRPPVVLNGVSNQKAVIAHSFDYDMSSGGTAFRDPDGDVLTYELRWLATVPDGLAFVGTHIKGNATKLGQFNATIRVTDSRGGELNSGILVTVIANGAPTVLRQNDAQVVSVGSVVEFDPLQGGTTFSVDPDGDPLKYVVSLSPVTHGLSINGTRLVGTFDSIGAVRVTVTATDNFGATSSNEFVIAAPAAEPAPPNLPVNSYIYDDFKLALPSIFITSRNNVEPLWDTTPATNPTTDAGATLGRTLFYDKRLSIANTHSCATCHQQQNGFADSVPLSSGVTGELTNRNAMGLTNARYNLRNAYFSDMRVTALEKLVLMPIEDHMELGNTLSKLIAKLSATSFYPQLFQAAFNTPEINSDRISLALAQFIRSLISYNTKIDQLGSDFTGSEIVTVSAQDASQVLTPAEQRGREVFVSGGCPRCHKQSNLTTFDPENNGLDQVEVDQGAGSGRFRAASLRNIARTAPYMHDGRFATLRDVIEHYDHGVKDTPNLAFFLREAGVGAPKRLNLSESDKEALITFLNTFTDNEILTNPKFSDPFR